MVIILCLPEAAPVTISNLNYSPLALGGIVVFAWTYWLISARFWFKGALKTNIEEDLAAIKTTKNPVYRESETMGNGKGYMGKTMFDDDI